MDTANTGAGVDPHDADTDIEPQREADHPAGHMRLRFTSIAARASVLAGTGLVAAAIIVVGSPTPPVSYFPIPIIPF